MSRRLGRVFTEGFPFFPFKEFVFSAISSLDRICEFRGLSILLEPGIFERSPRREREESLVSDLLKDG